MLKDAFVFQAVENVLVIGTNFPVNTHPNDPLNYTCYCTPTNESLVPDDFDWSELNRTSCDVC
jgi:solute carrier family 4 (sodium bicarbonate transporter), member 10